jgi:hypothetical protein
MNIQSLNSKLNDLKQFLSELDKNNVKIIAVALQEIWQIQHSDLMQIPNFNFIFLQRNNKRGGGVGFYVNKSVSFQKMENLTAMHDGIFECLTIEIKLNQKNFILSSVYRSPSLLNEFTTGFLENFENFLTLLNNNASPIFIFSDSNINLYNLGVCNIAQNYLNCIHSNGFLQKIFNSTRIQNQSASLIDHINCKNEPNNLTFGTIVTDISDHLTNFIVLNDTISKPKRKLKFLRKLSKDQMSNLSQDQMSNFRNALHALRWETVLQTQNCNVAFGEFWEIFLTLFNLYFPLTRQKFNKKYTT